MALIYPLSLESFYDQLPLVNKVHGLTEARELNETSDGQIRSVDYGARLWFGRLTLAIKPHQDAEFFLSVVRTLFSARGSFFISVAHMNGINIGTGVLNAVRNGREMRVSGLPANTTYRRGSYLSFKHGSNPVHYAMHQLVEGTITDVNGLTGWFEVNPPLEPGYVINTTAVEMAKPYCKAVAVPGTLEEPTHRSVVTENPSFEWRQSTV